MTTAKTTVSSANGDDKLSRTQLEMIKLEKFRALVRYAQQNSPYYAQIISDFSINLATCAPTDFPVLTKAILMANYDNIVTDKRISKQVVADFLTRSSDPKELLFNEIIVMHTSGTSGEVGYFLYTRRDYRRMRPGAFSWRRAWRAISQIRPKRIGRMRVAFFGATGGHYAGITGVAALQRGLLRLLVNAKAFEVNSPLPEVVTQLNKFQPGILFGYTTALKILGEQQQQGKLHIAPSMIAATGETVTKSDMNFLAEAFGGAKVISAYGCTEHLMLGMSNPDGDTMTLADDNLIFEFFDYHTLITNLFNYTIPLIRYSMSDILVPISDQRARRTVIKNLVGRSEQMPTFINAQGATDFISPHTINEIFVRGVTRFQLQITGASSFSFPICTETGLTAAAKAMAVTGVQTRLHEILQQKGLGNVTFEVPIVEDIPLNAHTRKFQLIVDKRAK